MITIDKKLFELLQGSSCFGIAPDMETPECKKCDVSAQCIAKMKNGESATPPMSKKIADEPVKKPSPKKSTETKSTTSKKKPATTKTESKKAPAKKSAPKKSTTTKTQDPNLPNFKAMSLDELKELAKERNVEWKEYGNDNITRMKLTMGLKKSY